MPAWIKLYSTHIFEARNYWEYLKNNECYLWDEFISLKATHKPAPKTVPNKPHAIAAIIIIVPCVLSTLLCKYPKITPPAANRIGINKVDIPVKIHPKMTYKDLLFGTFLVLDTESVLTELDEEFSEFPHDEQNLALSAHSKPHSLQNFTLLPPSKSL